MPPKSKNQHGLGRAIINKQGKDARQPAKTDLYTTDPEYRLKSVTQERDLDEFLNTAQLAATDFTAERQNVKIIQSPSLAASTAHNPFLLSVQEEKDALNRHKENRDRLRVPRRPPWTRDLTPQQLERQERDAFLDWRRSLAELVEENDLLLTPFERNIEVWRQLWRVLERSHLVVQIVDARNPLRFRCEDMESYVMDIEGPEGESGTATKDFTRRNLLLINKADLLTNDQRRQWADYFDQEGVKYAFFSAAHATALQQARKDAAALADAKARATEDLEEGKRDSGSDNSKDEEEEEEIEPSREQPRHIDGFFPSSSDSESDDEFDEALYYSAEEETSDDVRIKVLSVNELEELFLKSAPKLPPTTNGHPNRFTVGLVGYPNVGKSSTINSLLGEKKVSVSATPGKTKHFQTIHLSQDIVLCDCPGLVFPQFATQKAELVLDGVLPIDQLREAHGPVGLLANRIGREVLEATYGLTIRRRGEETGFETNIVTAEDLLIAYAIARGFTRAGQGNPDESRAARYLLKDYATAKLLFCHPPPGISEEDFNAPTKKNAIWRMKEAGKKKAPVTRVGKGADTFMAPILLHNGDGPAEGPKSQVLDSSFFANGTGLSARPFVRGKEFTRMKAFPHQHSVADDGTPIFGRRGRLLAVLANNPDGVGVGATKDKKHHKGHKRVKQRSGKGYD